MIYSPPAKASACTSAQMTQYFTGPKAYPSYNPDLTTNETSWLTIFIALSDWQKCMQSVVEDILRNKKSQNEILNEEVWNLVSRDGFKFVWPDRNKKNKKYVLKIFNWTPVLWNTTILSAVRKLFLWTYVIKKGTLVVILSSCSF